MSLHQFYLALIRYHILLAILILGAAAVAVTAPGCLDRPVVPATPTVTARLVDRAKQTKVTRLDILFMIDNSSSMADKQSVLAATVGDLVNRLVDPACIDPSTGLVVGSRQNGACAAGEPDFDPVNDIHIGIISSSLGSHGAGDAICPANDATRTNAHDTDMAHLLSRTLPNGQDAPEGSASAFMNLGFLDWSGTGSVDQVITTPFTSMVAGVGQHGCGYEAQLEATYRFLNDPNPYESITVDTSGGGAGVAVLNGTDTVLLQQRADFLRPDSLVAVIAITDENDCSIQDVNGGQGFYALLPAVGDPAVSQLGRGTSACLTNSNDPCCFNCGVSQPPANCTQPKDDPECQKGPLTRAEDPENLRCFDQKRRYGQDFLWPVARYIQGFTQLQVPDRDGHLVGNPLYSDLDCVNGKDATGLDCTPLPARDSSLVFFVGIVGLPWQDIAVNPADLGQGYKTAQQISDDNVWKTILGDSTNPSGPVLPGDPHMIESIPPRPGLPGPDSPPPGDPINGHEWNTDEVGPPNSDLQYACIFDLPAPTECVASNLDCDCNDGTSDLGGTVAEMRNPLCWNKTDDTYTHTQARAKGYPGLRELSVLQGLGDQAVVASICPVNVVDTSRPDFGYRPAISALIDRLRTALRGRCLPRTLDVASDGSVPCVVIEAYDPAPGQACDCPASAGRAPVDPGLVTPDIAGQGTCQCEIVQLAGDSLRTCQTLGSDLPPSVGDGWCYVDPAQQSGDINGACQVVQSCPDTDKRVIRFALSSSEPRSGGTAFITCQEASFPATGVAAGLTNPCAAAP
jgi:hypothetical protein